eukprot:15445576-Alexandrium_andersonii.AAC.9
MSWDLPRPSWRPSARGETQGHTDARLAASPRKEMSWCKPKSDAWPAISMRKSSHSSKPSSWSSSCAKESRDARKPGTWLARGTRLSWCSPKPSSRWANMRWGPGAHGSWARDRSTQEDVLGLAEAELVTGELHACGRPAA